MADKIIGQLICLVYCKFYTKFHSQIKYFKKNKKILKKRRIFKKYIEYSIILNSNDILSQFNIIIDKGRRWIFMKRNVLIKGFLLLIVVSILAIGFTGCAPMTYPTTGTVYLTIANDNYW